MGNPLSSCISLDTDSLSERQEDETNNNVRSRRMRTENRLDTMEETNGRYESQKLLVENRSEIRKVHDGTGVTERSALFISTAEDRCSSNRLNRVAPRVNLQEEGILLGCGSHGAQVFELTPVASDGIYNSLHLYLNAPQRKKLPPLKLAARNYAKIKQRGRFAKNSKNFSEMCRKRHPKSRTVCKNDWKSREMIPTSIDFTNGEVKEMPAVLAQKIRDIELI